MYKRQGFDAALKPGDQFYYCLSNEDRPNEREVGKGQLLDGGLIERSGATAFTSGAKTIALVAAAEYYSGASASDVREGQSVFPVNPASMFAAAAPVQLAYALALQPDFGAGINFDCTLEGDAYLADPVGAKPGQSGRIRIAQDAAGGRTLSFGPLWQFVGGKPVLSAEPGAVDVIAYFVGGDGAVEASLLPGLKALPAPISVSDFQHGYYSVGGMPKTFADLWQENAAYGNFAEGSIIPGVGWQTSSITTVPNALVATAGHLEGLGDLVGGFTFVFDYELVHPSGTKPRLVVELGKVSKGLTCWGYYQNGKSNVFTYGYPEIEGDNVFDSAYPSDQAPVGNAVVAATLSPNALAWSRDGEEVHIASEESFPNTPTNLTVACYTSHDSTGEPAVATLRSLAIYPVQPMSMLPLLAGR